MPKTRNEVRVLWFDPGEAATGWAFLILHRRVFIERGANWDSNILYWKTGELRGSEYEQLENAVLLMQRVRFHPMPYVVKTFIGTEQFDLVQTRGGRELLSPVRLNAVLDWECKRKTGLQLIYQSRSLRTSVTRPRLQRWGLTPVRGKDEFAAMQHAVTFIRRTKNASIERPWRTRKD